MKIRIHGWALKGATFLVISFLYIGMVGCMGKVGSASTSRSLSGNAVTADPEDGALRAASGPAQFPTLLSTYRYRTTWRVAGVDYAVGFGANQQLADPAGLALTGVSLDTALQRITITANDIILDGYDFAKNGGWTLNIVGASNVHIAHSQFAITSAFGSFPPIMADAQSKNLYIGYNVIDGGGSTVHTLNPNTLISLAADAVVEYNWLKNSPGDLVEAAALPAGSSLVMRYNLLENAGQLSNADGNYLKVGSGLFTSLALHYNTLYQIAGGPLGTGGLNLYPGSDAGDGITSLDVSHSTTVASGSPGVLSFVIATNPALTGTGKVHDCFADTSGTIEFGYAGSDAGNLIFSNNKNMSNGSALLP